MMAICPNCHYSIDSYTEIQQRRFKENPYNKLKDNPKGQLVIAQNVCAVTTGTLFLLGDGPVIKSGDETYLEIFVSEQGLLEISLKLFDRTNNLVLEIERNDWKKGNTSIWDIEFRHKSKLLEVREKKGVINLKVDAHQLPVEIQGRFWISGNFVSLSNQGVSIDNLKIIKPAINSKYVKLHYFPDSTPLHFKREGKDRKVTFSGPSIYSGMYIDLDIIDKGLTLQPKPQPFFFESEKNTNSEEAVRLLEQQIETLEFFYTEETYFSPSMKKAWSKPIHGYTLICKQESCLIFFIERLAAYLFSLGRHEESLEKYKQLEAICTNCLIYNPDTILGEAKFAISKVLEAQDRKIEAIRYYKESVNFYLKKSGGIPYRILEFSKNLFSIHHPCFCDSGRNYGQCHSRKASLAEYEKFFDAEINLSGIEDDAKIKIFVNSEESYSYSTKKTHTYEEYLNEYNLIFLDFYKSITPLMLSKILGLDGDISRKTYEVLLNLGVINDGNQLIINLCKNEDKFIEVAKSLESLSDLSQELIQAVLIFLRGKAIQNFNDSWNLSIRINRDTPILIVVKKPHESPWVIETILTRAGICINMSSIKRGRINMSSTKRGRAL
jgi:tetratricopeptide (TPR) repeat protein